MMYELSSSVRNKQVCRAKQWLLGADQGQEYVKDELS